MGRPTYVLFLSQDLLNFDDPLNIDAAEHHLRDKVTHQHTSKRVYKQKCFGNVLVKEKTKYNNPDFMYIGNKIVFNKCSIYRPALCAEHLQACVSSKPIHFLNASCFRRISGRKFRTSSKTMQDDVSEPHSHACDFGKEEG